ncbi:MAG: hypothetical protein ACE5I5_08725 [Candidatus Heimdallarchaeota archaeon]
MNRNKKIEMIKNKDNKPKNKVEKIAKMKETEHNNDNDDRDNKKAREKDEESSIRLSLKIGGITGLPKDLSSAPPEIHLSSKFHKKSYEALKRAKASGNEWGYFIHSDEEGHLMPGKLKEGTPHEWISLEEYSKAQQQDETIQGLMHTHLEERTVFSPSNIGVFLAANDSVYKCMNLQGNYLIMLRTERTDPPREGIFREVVNAYAEVAREKASQYIIKADLDEEEARKKSLFEAMREICKRYNIALFMGGSTKAAKKVV